MVTPKGEVAFRGYLQASYRRQRSRKRCLRPGIDRSHPLNGVAPERKVQSGAEFAQAVIVQSSHALPQSPLRNGDGVVKVHRAWALHAVCLIERYLGGNAAHGRRKGGATVTVER